MDLKTTFLQGEPYDNTQDILCQIPPEMGDPPYIAALMKKPAYGLNDAPRRRWNVVDSALKKFGLAPTRADRCTYVLYGDRVSKGTPKNVSDLNLEIGLDFMLDPVMHNQAQGRSVHGTVCLHVDDLFMSGDAYLEKIILQKFREEFQVGSGDKNDALFVG